MTLKSNKLHVFAYFSLRGAYEAYFINYFIDIQETDAAVLSRVS